MFILRVLKNAYELFDATDVVRLAKSSVRNVAALGLATRMLDADGDTVIDAPVFVGSGFAPSSPGTDSLVYLKPGVAFLYDSGEGDAWLGQVKIAYSDEVDSVALATNVDGSGDDRIDVVSLRPLEVEEDSQLRYFKDPTSLAKYQANSPQRVRLDYEIVVTTGVVAPVPAAPATPAGTFKVAEVLRINGQANVNPTDVTDSRNLDRVRAGFVDAFAGIASRAGALYFGDPSGNHYRLERDSDTAPTRLRFRDQAGVGAVVELGEVYSETYLSTKSAIRFGNKAIADASRLHIAPNSTLAPSYLKIAKGDGTIGAVHSLMGVKCLAKLRFTGGSWVVDYSVGFGAVTDNGIGDWTIAIADTLADLNTAAAMVTLTNLIGDFKIVAIADSTTTVQIQGKTNAGVAADPPSGARATLIVIGGN